MIVIGLGHRAGVGKDLLADYLVEHHGFKKLAFADPLKRAARHIFGFTHAQVTDQVQKAAVDPFWGFTPRHALQKLGTESVRNVFGDDTWVRAAERSLQLEATVQKRDRFVFTDVRFPSEADWLKKIGVIWKINRPGISDRVSKRTIVEEIFSDDEIPMKIRQEREAWFDDRTNTELHASESALIEYNNWDAVLEATDTTASDKGVKLQEQAEKLLKGLL